MLQPRNPPPTTDRFGNHIPNLPFLLEPLSSSSPPSMQPRNPSSTPIDELPNFPLFGSLSSRPRPSPPLSEPASEPEPTPEMNKRKATMSPMEKREDEITWKSIAESQRVAAEGWKKLADEWKVLVDRYKGELDDMKHDMTEWKVRAEALEEERDQCREEMLECGYH
ncbi:hypothetical protein JCM3765_006563 [Sporobolomyces pararoseus]